MLDDYDTVHKWNTIHCDKNTLKCKTKKTLNLIKLTEHVPQWIHYPVCSHQLLLLTWLVGGSVAEWLACWTQAEKGLGSNRSRDAVVWQSYANCSQLSYLCSPSSETGNNPLKGCQGNCRPGEKLWQPTAGFMTHVTCTLTAKNRDQLRNPTLSNRVRATFFNMTSQCHMDWST